MASLPDHEVTAEPSRLDGLDDGSAYMLQNRGVGDVFLWEGARSPSAAQRVNAFRLPPFEILGGFFRVTKEAGQNFYVWGSPAGGSVKIAESA